MGDQMELQKVGSEEINTLLPTQESMLVSSDDLARERKERRIKACRERSGLTAREWQNLKQKYIITDENRAVNEAAVEFVGSQNTNLLICGTVGAGKTRIAHGIVAAMVEQGVHAEFWTATKFMMTLRAKSLETDEIDAMQAMTCPKVLVLDDLGANKETAWTVMMMDTVIDDWYRAGRKGLVVTSNFTLDQIAMQVSDRLASRFVEMCQVFELKGKDWRIGK